MSESPPARPADAVAAVAACLLAGAPVCERPCLWPPALYLRRLLSSTSADSDCFALSFSGLRSLVLSFARVATTVLKGSRAGADSGGRGHLNPLRRFRPVITQGFTLHKDPSRCVLIP